MLEPSRNSLSAYFTDTTEFFQQRPFVEALQLSCTIAVLSDRYFLATFLGASVQPQE